MPSKMPPLNENNGSAYPEAQIPGMTLMNDGQAAASTVSLRTHSSKFPVRFSPIDKYMPFLFQIQF